ncbi:MAG TPA: FliH/SctL family protein [Oscillospiraceae bacterium]|nr:FliH/SctL family protein [Oscillospiraceae bacterium]
MSRVYKRDEVILGKEKVIKLKVDQIIKSNANKINNNVDNEGKGQLYTQAVEDPQTIIDEAKLRADAIIKAAELESDEIINKTEIEQQAITSEAYTESNKVLENAREKGYKQGLSEGKEAGLKTVDNLIEEIKQIKQNVLFEKKVVAKKLEEEIIELVISCIKKVTNHELEKDHELLLNLIENGIERCTYTDTLIIRVSENNYETVNPFKNKIYIMTEGIDNIEIKKDPALEDGSIIIETISGTVDAGIQTQIAQIEQMFHDILKGE